MRYRSTRAFMHEAIVTRSRSLLRAGFDFETVIASAQAVTQALKRLLEREMNERCVGVRKRYDLTSLTPLTTKAERNLRIRWFGGLPRLETRWGTLCAGRVHASLAEVVDRIAGPRTRNDRLGGKWDDAHDGERRGPFLLRHALVHGLHSPPRALVERVAADGVQLVYDLLHPSTGRAAVVGHDPFARLRHWADPPMTWWCRQRSARGRDARTPGVLSVAKRREPRKPTSRLTVVAAPISV